mgnify:CR=1 FL=1
MKTPFFTGACTALVTPFANGKINLNMLDHLLQRQILNHLKQHADELEIPKSIQPEQMKKWLKQQEAKKAAEKKAPAKKTATKSTTAKASGTAKKTASSK